MAKLHSDVRAPRRTRPVCVFLLAAAAWAAPTRGDEAKAPDAPGLKGQGDRAKAPAAPGLRGQGATITTDTGKPVGDDRNSTTAGSEGPTLLQDFYLVEKLARFDRERIPERVVHARGVGVHGEFVSSGDASKWTKAAFLSAEGKK
ncbi:MAG: catalase, partial [Singulisphaera sp.]